MRANVKAQHVLGGLSFFLLGLGGGLGGAS